MTTIKDVAHHAKVSPATVSRYINNRGYVGTDTRQRIAKAIEELNYVPNEVARSLFQKKSKLIGLLLPDIANPFFPLLAQGVEDYFHQYGYHVIFGNIQENPDKIAAYLKMFQQNFVAGILSAVPLDSNKLNKATVIVDRTDCQSTYSIAANNQQGAQLIVDAITATSFQDIVIIAGPQEVVTANTRFHYVTRALANQGVKYQVLENTSYRFNDALTTADRLFTEFPRVDTVIAANDVQAIAIIQKANQLKRRVPEDLQIIGYDDISMSELTIPRLTTIQQPAFAMGWQAAEMLYQLINDEDLVDKHRLLDVKLMTRDTLRK